MLHAWKVANIVPSLTGMSIEKDRSLNLASIPEQVIEFVGGERQAI